MSQINSQLQVQAKNTLEVPKLNKIAKTQSSNKKMDLGFSKHFTAEKKTAIHNKNNKKLEQKIDTSNKKSDSFSEDDQNVKKIKDNKLENIDKNSVSLKQDAKQEVDDNGADIYELESTDNKKEELDDIKVEFKQTIEIEENKDLLNDLQLASNLLVVNTNGNELPAEKLSSEELNIQLSLKDKSYQDVVNIFQEKIEKLQQDIKSATLEVKDNSELKVQLNVLEDSLNLILEQIENVGGKVVDKKNLDKFSLEEQVDFDTDNLEQLYLVLVDIDQSLNSISNNKDSLNLKKIDTQIENLNLELKDFKLNNKDQKLSENKLGNILSKLQQVDQVKNSGEEFNKTNMPLHAGAIESESKITDSPNMIEKKQLDTQDIKLNSNLQKGEVLRKPEVDLAKYRQTNLVDSNDEDSKYTFEKSANIVKTESEDDGQLLSDSTIELENDKTLFVKQTTAQVISQEHIAHENFNNERNISIEKSQIQQMGKAIEKLDMPLRLMDNKADADLASRIQLMLGKNLKHVDIRLDPPELGKLEIKLSIHDNKTHIQINVLNHQTKELLDNTMPRLREMLAQQGVELGQTEINHGSEQQGNNSFSQQSEDNKDSGLQGRDGVNLSNKSDEKQETSQVVDLVYNEDSVDYYA